MYSGWKIGALLACAACALGSLTTGAPWLETGLPGGLPLGNALAALGLCAIAGAAVTIASPGWVRLAAIASLVAAAAWLPVSIALAGNLALVFSGPRGDVWLAWSAGVAAFALFALALATLHRMVAACVRRLAGGAADAR